MKITRLTTICYIEKDGKTLMLYRNRKKNDIHEGKYVGIGGKFEPGETPEECISREITEETGLVANKLKYHGLISFPDFKEGEDWYMFLFSCRDFEGEVSEERMNECPEGKLVWVENEKVLDLNMWDGDRIFMEWLVTGKIFNAKIEYEDGVLKKYSVDFY